MIIRFSAAVALFAVPLAVACSVSTSEIDDVPVLDHTDPIINGVKDTGHPGVVALTMTKSTPSGDVYSGCTGTMVSVDLTKKIGYVLTAAHCTIGATSVSVSQTNDKKDSASLVSYGFIDHTEHPSYSGATTSPYDVAIVRVLGVSATTPVVPMLSPDTLVKNQTRVTSVGFGQTVRPNAPPSDAGANTAKNRIDGTVATLTTTEVGVRYDNNGDICQGDSGGPVLTTVAGKEYVAAVHSYVTGPCVGIGYSVRASAHKSFYQTVMSKPAPAETCDTCKKTATSGSNVCGEARRACYNDPQCSGLRSCLTACTAAGGDAGASDECRKQCGVQFPFGAAKYNHSLVYCACNACETQCAGDTTCAAVPACGMTLLAAGTTTAGGSTAEACNTCMNGGCCDEQDACGKDGLCYRCTRTPETAGCDTSALYKRLNTCKAQRCASACN